MKKKVIIGLVIVGGLLLAVNVYNKNGIGKNGLGLNKKIAEETTKNSVPVDWQKYKSEQHKL